MFFNISRRKRGIEQYRKLLGARYRTFLFAFEEFLRIGGSTVVELGTSRSFVSGTRKGCMVNDRKYWRLHRPRSWDWGAGIFTRMSALHLADAKPHIHTVDVSREALEISKVITEDLPVLTTYHLETSEQFLRRFPAKIDLLYMDTGESGEEACKLHLREAEIIVDRDVISPQGIILIDDVNVPQSGASKGKYSIPFLCKNGFEIKISDYQVVMQRPLSPASAASNPAPTTCQLSRSKEKVQS